MNDSEIEIVTQPLRVVSFRKNIITPIGPGTIDPIIDRHLDSNDDVWWWVRWDDGIITKERNYDLRVIGEV